MFNSPKSIGKYSILRLFFHGKVVDSGKNLVSPSGVTWNCGKVGRYWLLSAFVGLVALAENSVILMYQVNVGLLSTNLLMLIVVHLIHVHA